MNKLIVLSLGLLLAGAVSVRAADAKENWDKTCAKCHGGDGKGQTKMGQKLNIKDFTDAKTQAAFTDDQAFKAIKEGLTDKEGKVVMKAQESMTDDEVKALVGFVRSLKK